MNVLIAAHDTGGAEILSSYAVKNPDNFNISCFLYGSAINIFQKKSVPNCIYQEDLHILKILEKLKPAIVITGTGWQADIELNFIKAAKQLNIHTIAFLDNWNNYRERFKYPNPNWENNLSDELWVADEYAYAIAKKFFKNTKITIKTNYSLNDILVDANKYIPELYPGKKYTKILYLSQPTSLYTLKQYNNDLHFGFNEYTIASHLMEIIDNNDNLRLKIRLHPSEAASNPDKYDNICISNKIPISKSHKFVEDIMNSDIAIGVDSMALVIAVCLNKKAINYKPSTNPVFILPHENILRINNPKELKKIINDHRHSRGFEKTP